jgi:putative transposase
MVCENTVIKSRKIKIYPTKEQRNLLNKWLGTSRFVYNQTVEYLKQDGSKPIWMDIKTGILNELPEWSKETPYQIKSIAIKDVCIASKNNISKYRKTDKISKLKFRSKKNLTQSMYIPKSAIKESGIYYTILGKLKYSEKLPENILDSRLIKENENYYINLSHKIIVTNTNDNQGRVVALDPGVRTFITYFSENSCGKLSKYSIGRIQRICYHLDDLLSRISKEKSKKRKKRMKIAANRMRIKIRNLVSELHWKSIKFLFDNFDVILLPEYNTSNMVLKGNRKINYKTARQLLTYSSYLFKQRILHKAKECNKKVIICNEAYTSKTVSWTGEIRYNLGSSKTIKSGNIVMDRDYNGARGIFLRALVDTPTRETLLQDLCLS